MHPSTIEHQQNCLECVERAKEEYAEYADLAIELQERELIEERNGI
jgi:hypothetical protein